MLCYLCIEPRGDQLCNYHWSSDCSVRCALQCGLHDLVLSHYQYAQGVACGEEGLSSEDHAGIYGVSGIAMPFVLSTLLNTYVYALTLGAFAVALVVLIGPVLPFLKGRLLVSRTSRRRTIDTVPLREPLFYFFASSVLLQGLGHFFPILYLPYYAGSLVYSPSIGALLFDL